jgi:hypothetical protein
MRMNCGTSVLLGCTLLFSTLGAGEATSALASAPLRPASIAKACTLLSTADMKAVAGSARVTHSGTQGPFTTCDYVTKSGAFIFLIADQTGIKAKTPYTSTAAYWRTTVTSTVIKKKVTIKGIGKSAVWMPEIGGLFVLSGNAMFNIAQLPVRKQTLGLLEKLAQRILKHLK